MVGALTKLAKRLTRRRWYPILLPHHCVSDQGVSALGGPPRPMAETVLAALRLCDGTRTLAAVSRAAAVPVAQLLGEELAEVLLLWPHKPLPPVPALQRRPGPVFIILSPHLDDAALSRGTYMLYLGAIGDPAIVVDVFSRVSWWRFEVNDAVMRRVQATRDAEEELVMRLTGSSLRRWDLAEAPLRGYPLKEIFTTARGAEAAGTHATIREKVRSLAVEVPVARWSLPLGIGNHIDHRIARDAALDGLRDAGVPADHVRFYEDLPYAAQQPGVQDFSGFLADVMPGCRLTAGTIRVSPDKRRLLSAYWSQLTSAQIEAVQSYASRINRRRPSERVWGFDLTTLERFGRQIPPLGPLV